ncbi:MAG: hypothetical protein Kow0065_11340 [Methylomicrobium sp.]
MPCWPYMKAETLGDLGEPVLLFNADHRFMVFGRVGLGLVLFEQGLKLQGQFGEKMACAAGVVDGHGRRGVVAHQAFQRQAHQDKAADGHGREELPLALLDALIEEALEHITEKLVVAAGVSQADVLPHLQEFQQHISVLVKEPFIVDIDKGKVVVGEKFLLDKQVPHRPLGGVRILADETQCVVDVVLVDVGNVLAEKLGHALLIKLLQAIHQVKMAVVGDPFPVKLEVIGVLDLVHQLAEEEVHQLVKGVFPARNIMLTQDGGELVVFLLLIRGGNSVQVGQGILILADLIGLDVVLENPLGGEIEFVGVAPDREALLDVGGTAEGFEMWISDQVLIVVAVGDDMALVTQLGIFKIRGIEAEKLGLANLLGVTKKLVAVLLGLVPGLFELGPSGLALDDQQRLAVVILDQNIGPATASTSPQLPFRFQFDVLRFVAFFQQAMDALKHDKIFIRREVAGLAFVDDQAVGFGIMDGLLGDIDA